MAEVIRLPRCYAVYLLTSGGWVEVEPIRASTAKQAKWIRALDLGVPPSRLRAIALGRNPIITLLRAHRALSGDPSHDR